MFLRAWRWFEGRSHGPHAGVWLGVYSFLHTLVIPVPTDLLLAPMVIANRRRAVYFTATATLGAVVGAAVGYAAVALAYASVLAPLVADLGLADEVAAAAATLGPYAFVATLVTALTPLPDVPVIIAAGLLHANAVTFLLAYALGRALRLAAVSTFTLLGASLVAPSKEKDVQ